MSKVYKSVAATDPNSLPKNLEFPVVEAKMLEKWANEKTYSFDENSSKPVYAIDTPPPTVSGSLHVGHMFSYTQTDVIARYQRMKGKNVFYPMGLGRQRTSNRTSRAKLFPHSLRCK
jgi:valyl-tRNA synthetase